MQKSAWPSLYPDRQYCTGSARADRIARRGDSNVAAESGDRIAAGFGASYRQRELIVFDRSNATRSLQRQPCNSQEEPGSIRLRDEEKLAIFLAGGGWWGRRVKTVSKVSNFF